MRERRLWDEDLGFEDIMEVRVQGQIVNPRLSTTSEPGDAPCLSSGHRRCKDGSCIAKVDLCSEEQTMNQNTIFIMIVVGMVVVIVLIILYCFQQRSQRRALNRNANQSTLDNVGVECDNSSLNMPPPTYEEVVNTNLYPATPVLQRNVQMSSDVEPRTPPPNYDTALHILAHSHDSIFPTKVEPTSPVVRRTISTELGSPVGTRSPRPETDYR
uniref:Uncharacterized protein n=1 Tax=Arion vulgaris TaxID=1028688 RepID=A0A0B7AZN3_9EUPU